MRRTKKYYKDQVSKGVNAALYMLPEIVNKYGKNPIGKRGKQQLMLIKPDSWWNHYITDFHFYGGKLFANVYWQGPDIDGDTIIQIVPGRTSYHIPAEYFHDGVRTRLVHGDLNITSEELFNTIKRLVNSL